MNSTKQAPTVFGGSQYIDGSEFISYAAKVTTIEEVRIAYRKLRVKYADANHIMSAFRLNPPNGPYNQEANDDGEHAGGRTILNVLQESQSTNVAVFIIRFYGGRHLGATRFEIIRSLSQAALTKVGIVPPTPRSQNARESRRQTRSMSQRSVRGRGGAHSTRIAGESNSTDLHTELIPPQSTSTMVRSTPFSSPSVSPTQTMQNVALQGYASSIPSSIPSGGDSEYEDTQSAQGTVTDAESVNSYGEQSADDEEQG